MDYQKKYLKYKNKYLSLKKGGGIDNTGLCGICFFDKPDLSVCCELECGHVFHFFCICIIIDVNNRTSQNFYCPDCKDKTVRNIYDVDVNNSGIRNKIMKLGEESRILENTADDIKSGSLDNPESPISSNLIFNTSIFSSEHYNPDSQLDDIREIETSIESQEIKAVRKFIYYMKQCIFVLHDYLIRGGSLGDDSVLNKRDMVILIIREKKMLDCFISLINDNKIDYLDMVNYAKDTKTNCRDLELVLRGYDNKEILGTLLDINIY
jgi:hypothetical protein